MSDVNAGRLGTALADRYRIERELGAGGMATVYLAADLKHDRKVAIKVLKPELAAVLGAERFVQEIKTTAALSHPHILPLFDSGEADGFLYYVMPYIQGETIREKLNRETQFGIDEAVKIATEVADALDYAHGKGVIHRDIKPENILLANGRPMVADFGIALAVSAAAGGRMTETGLSLGTPHYMSPEQATAEKEITGRSDVYSLASVLYEMLAGQPPHLGGTAQQIIMKIIAEPVAEVTRHRKAVPAHIAAALAIALEKLPADRFTSAAEFGAALKDRSFTSATATPATVTGARSTHATWLRDPRTLATFGVALAAVVIALGTRGRNVQSVSQQPVRFSVPLPDDSTVVNVAASASSDMSLPVVSDNGRHIAFAAATTSGPRLYLRSTGEEVLHQVPGRGRWPFFSPESRSLAFFRESDVWRLDLTETEPTRVGTLPERPWDIIAAVWHPDGRILATGSNGVWALPADGGEPTLLVRADSTMLERLNQISVLRDGRILLEGTTQKGPRIRVLDPDGGGARIVFPGLSAVQIVDDIMIYQQAGQTRASRVDPGTLELRGTPVAVNLQSMRVGRSTAWVDERSQVALEAMWVTPSGAATRLGIRNFYYRWPRISPDGTRIAIGFVQDQVTPVKVVDLRSQAVTDIAGYTEPVWTPDSRSVVTSLGNRPNGGLVMRAADASRPPDTLLVIKEGDAWPTDVSRDGKWLLWYGATLGAGTGPDSTDANDLFVMDLATKQSRRIQLPGDQRGARFSPDGRWVAYQSVESGREGIHVRPFPAMDANFAIATDGGREPIWSPDGRTLHYRRQESVIAVPVTATNAGLERGPERELFSGIWFRDPFGDISWDIGRDGRFLMMRPVLGARLQVEVKLNWIDEIRTRLDRAQREGAR